MRTLALGIVASSMLAFGVGCNKSAPDTAKAPTNISPAATNPPSAGANAKPTAEPAPAPAPSDSLADNAVARLHWLGKKRLATETNAAYFMSLWNLPESARLETQTLDKLALNLGHWQPPTPSTSITNYQPLVAGLPAAALVRPLLEDLLQEESYFALRQPAPAQPGEWALAIKLNADRAAQWQAVLTNALFPLANRCQIARAGDWTVLGAASPASPATNALMTALVARFQTTNSLPPFTPSLLPRDPAAVWIEADLDLARTAAALALDWKRGPELPKISLAILGDGTNVRTRAELEFPKPLGLELDAWKIPTNFIREPLVGFSAVRGIRPWLQSLKLWNELQLGPAPNQAFFWAQSGGPSLHFAALPAPDATNKVNKFIDYVLGNLNPIFASSGLGAFQRTNLNRLAWRGMPLFSPSLEPVGSDLGPFILAGYAVPRVATNYPTAPPELLAQVQGSTNLVWYDWELTQQSLQSLTTMAQLTRHLFNEPRLDAGQASLPWFFAIAYRLGNSVTTLNATSPTHLSFLRKSSLGLTGVELQVLADWLESPRFPFGLYTFKDSAPGQPATPAGPPNPATPR